MPNNPPEFPHPPTRITVSLGPKKRYAIDISARELPDAAEKPPAQVIEMPKPPEEL